MSIYIGYVYTDDDNPVHIMINAKYKVYIMNALLNTAILSVISINANNYVLLGDSMFEDCGLEFDLLTEKEEALYEKYFKGAIKTHKYNEEIRLNDAAIARANAYLRNRAI